jgi:hypothetical protein
MATVREYLDRKYSAFSRHEPQWERLPNEILRADGAKYEKEAKRVKGLFTFAKTEQDLEAVRQWFRFFLDRTYKVENEFFRRRLEQLEFRNPRIPR